MARLKEYNGHYCESEYEYAFIGFLEAEGWKYTSGNKLSRVTKRDVLIEDDFKKFIADGNLDLTEDEVTQIYDTVRLVGAESDFATLHKVYNWLVDGIQFTPKDGIARMIPLINFEKDGVKNIFRVVNQFTVEYTNNGQKENRRPDVILFVNGMPLCIMELKNPADANATIYDAWEQINIRYWRDIPHLLHYCPLACISDGVKTRLGTVRTPYEHFYAWRRVNDGDAVSTLPFAETETMIKGVYSPERFLEIFRDYIYFQDSIYDSDEVEIVCRYPQFFAARLLKQSIVNSVVTRSGKGGTYFGATGCGKTYTMAFLARQLALRCTDIPEIGSPTIILIVDRDELQKQGSKLFTKSKEFLNLGEVSVVKNRTQLRQELGARQSGGFYICTIQKFCDREDDKIGLINDRQNIICFSDEAHRTQLEHSKKIQFSKDADENMKAMVSKPYAKVLKEAFPHATFVGFTGTPIAETYQTFGDEIDRYTMDQAVADGLTVSIKYHPRIAKVLLDNKKVKEIENYYKKCVDDGATYEDNILYVIVDHDKLDYYQYEVGIFNNNLYNSKKQQLRKIDTFANHLYVKNYYETTKSVIEKLQKYTLERIDVYSDMIDKQADFMQEIDDDNKRKIVANIYMNSKLGMIYGAAGTGKTRVAEYIAKIFEDKNILLLANTNAAKNNLERRIKSSCDCYTVYDYLKNGYSWKKYDLVILDECSTVCNEDVLNLFEKCNAEAYLLIGDIYQIEAIKFGNWFNFARYFVDKKSVYELVTPYRAKDKSILLDMWTCVRNFDENMFERLLANGFISTLNESIFERDDDEIVLCLGYDGLYGVNNINRYMQKINPSKPIEWGNWTYKVGDKVLFNESRRFGNVLYNNLKGSILSIDKKTDEIVFQILVDKIISERDVLFSDIKLIDCDCEGKSIVEFSVKRRVERDSDSDYSEQIVPFQIAYAVSIHKAQGLEYKSVKVVITEDIDEKISHNIFYTAITRTTDKLKIYMSKETQKKLAEKFVKSNVGLKQAQLFAGQAGLKLKNKLSS